MTKRRIKPTPEEWFVMAGNGTISAKNDNKFIDICHVYKMESVYPEKCQQAKANAVMMAGSPIMYNALGDMIKALERLLIDYEDHMSRDDRQRLVSILDKAKSAKKAAELWVDDGKTQS